MGRRGMMLSSAGGALVLALCMLGAMIAQRADAQGYAITGTSQQTIDFTGFTGAGFDPNPTAGQLDSDEWAISGFGTNVAFGGSESSGDPARGTSVGGESTGGVWAFAVSSGNAALGVQPGISDFTPGTFTLRIVNSTGSSITSIDLAYNVYIFNDADRSGSFNFEHSPDDSNYTQVAALDETSTEAQDASPSWQMIAKSTTISLATPLANNGQYYLRWYGDDVGGSGSRDEFALDDIQITATTGGGASPTITTTGTLNAFSTTSTGTPSSEQSYTVSGSNLTADISVMAPSEFEISTTSGSGFGGSLTLTQNGGSVSQTTIYVRYNPSTGTSHSDVITHTSTGATQRDVPVSGAVVSGAFLSEDFESYTTGMDLPTGTGMTWVAHSGSSGFPQIVNGALSNALELSDSRFADVSSTLPGAPLSAGSVSNLYYGFDVVFTALPQSGGSHFAHLKDDQFDYTARVWADVDNGNIRIGISNNSGGMTELHPTTLQLNSLYRVVVRYDFTTGQSTIWVDPMNEASTSATATTAPDLVGVYDIAFRQAGSIGTLEVDNLTVADNFSDARGMAQTGPIISINGSVSAFSTSAAGTPSMEQSYAVSGMNLTADITLAAPMEFEISTTSGSGFSSMITLPQSGGSVASTTIYVRYNPMTGTSHSGDLTHSSTGANTRTLSLSGIVSAGTQGYPVMAGGPQTIDLSGYDGSGLAAVPAAGQLNSSHWRVRGLSDGDTEYDMDYTSGDHARGSTSGGVTSGGLYALSTGMVTAVGVQPTSGDFTPGSIDLRLSNQTGGAIDTIVVAYEIWVLNNGARANTLNFLYSAEDMQASYQAFAAADFTTPEASDASPSWVKTDRTVVINLATQLQANESYYLRFESDDVSGSGSRDEFGIANVTIEMTTGGVGGNSAPTARLATGSSFTGNEGGPFTLNATVGTALAMADLELIDAEGDMINIVSVMPATANGVLAPGVSSGISSGTNISFTGTPAASGTESFDIVLSDATGQRTVRINISASQAGNSLPELARPQTGNSLFGGSSANGWVYPASLNNALVDANLELLDADGTTVTVVSVTPNSASNGITPPSAGAGMSGDAFNFSGTPTMVGTTSFSVVLQDDVGDMSTVIVSFDVVDSSGAADPSVLINEIAYESASMVSGEEAEFIELYNTTSNTISLAGWKLSSFDQTITFPTGTLIPANGYLVISNKLSRVDFLGYYGVTPNLAPDNSNPVNVANMNLDNTGGVVGLTNASGELVDLVGYGAAPRGTGAGGLPGFAGTSAILLTAASVDGSLARYPNGENSDLVTGQHTTEDAENSFSDAPWSPGMNNDLPVIVIRSGTMVIARSATTQANHEITLNGMSEANLTANPLGISVRYISSNPVDVSYAYNAGLSTYADLMESGLTLPSNTTGNIASANDFAATSDSLSGQAGAGMDNGTPITVSGVAAVTITVFDSTVSEMIQNVLLITVVGELQITTAQDLPNAVAGVAYNDVFLNAFGGTPPYSWSATNAPAWLTLTSDGEVTATSPVAGQVTFTATVSDSASNSRMADFTLVVSGGTVGSNIDDGGDGCSIGSTQGATWLLLLTALFGLALFARPRTRA